VSLPQIVCSDFQRGFQYIVGVIVEGDTLQDLEKLAMLSELLIFPVIGSALPQDHRGNVALFIE
jgi:hypothetical protein